MADSYAVYTGQAMKYLQGYATSAFTTAKGYLDDLHSYIAEEIDFNPPDISIDVSQSIVIDPQLATEKPTPPDFSAYPSLPTEPTTSDHEFPAAPDYTIPSPPVMTDFTIPEYIEGTLSTITTSIPTINFSVPGIADITTTDVAQDSLMQTIKERLENNILDGGTMLDPSVESDIWNRDLERNEQALQDSIDKLTSQWAKLGFDMPDGLLAGSIIALNNEYTNKRLDRSREISVKQAELEHQGLFKSIELGISLENIIVNSQNEYARRVLESAKTTADVTISLFKERVNMYNASLEAFKADLIAYKTSVEAEAARAEVYKARMGGLQILASVDETKVKAYQAQLAAIGQTIEVYNTQVKTVATMYEVERQKIEGYKAKVDGYVAAIEGITKKYLGEVEGYKSYIQAWVATSDSQTKLLDVKSRADIASLEATIKEWEVQLRLIQEATNVKLEALKTVSTVSSNLAAGALSAIHASVSDSYQRSTQTQYYHDQTAT